jgi:hypothetical protein
MKTLIIILISIIALILFFGTYLIGLHNTQAALQVLIETKQKDNTSQFDNMWKQIQQTAQVTEEQKNALKDIFTSYAQARTGTGGAQDGSLAKWTTEAVPNVDTKTFQNLQNIITSTRDNWTQRQTELLGLANEYNTNLVNQPGGLFLSLMGFKHIDVTIVTSTRTEKAFESGKDDDVSLPTK